MEEELIEKMKGLAQRVAAGETTIDALAAELGWTIIDDWREGRCVVPERPLWVVADEGGDWPFPDARAPEEAAQAYVDDADWIEPSLRTQWANVVVYRPAIDENGNLCRLDDQRMKVAIPADEPPCVDEEHDWHAPHEIVGGCESNPGVWSHGGGVVIVDVCVRCGCARVTDTWAQDPSDGTQGLESVEYQPGKYADALRKRSSRGGA